VTPAAPGEAQRHPTRTLAALVAAATGFALAQTMIIPAIPGVIAEYGATPEHAAWLMTGFLLVAAITTPLVGRLGDMFGKDRLLRLALVLFGIGSLIAATADSMGQLVAGRCFQGLGGGVIPLSMAIVREQLPREKVGVGIGFIGATFGIGGGFGLVLAGALVDHASISWIFWAGALSTALSLAAVHRFVPASPDRSPAKVDWGGALLLGLGLGAVLVAISQGNLWGWGSGRVLGLVAGGFAVLALWVAYERRLREPLVDLGLLASRPVWTTNASAFALGFAMFGGFILVPQLVETPPSAGYGLGATATVAGLLLVPSSIVMLGAGPLAGRIGGRLPILIGCVAAGLGYAYLAVLHTSGFHIAAANALLGLGIGMSFAATANLIVEAAPRRQAGQAVAMNTILRMIGGALGGQVASAVVAAERLSSGVPAESGYVTAFALAAAATVVAFGVALLIPRRPRVEPPVAVAVATAPPLAAGARAA
jgi:EmrB/QacA subfamily drug resistance transporter